MAADIRIEGFKGKLWILAVLGEEEVGVSGCDGCEISFEDNTWRVKEVASDVSLTVMVHVRQRGNVAVAGHHVGKIILDIERAPIGVKIEDHTGPLELAQ